MNKKFLMGISIVLAIIAIVFLCISIFLETKNTIYLSIALASSFFSNLINVIMNRKK